MSKLIRVLMILATSMFTMYILIQCKKKEKEIEILYFEKDSYYSFLIESKNYILYSTPKSSELQTNTAEARKNIIFESELKNFKPYELSVERKQFENLYISNVLTETNFSNNHLFDYDIEINKSGYIKTNIYYPYDLKGSYKFTIDIQTIDVLSRLLYKISSKKINETNIKFNNVIILNNNEIFKEEQYVYSGPEYSLILALVNKILLENINNKTNKIKQFDSPSKRIINRSPLPPSPPQKKNE